jgi:hypothetical protein
MVWTSEQFEIKATPIDERDPSPYAYPLPIPEPRPEFRALAATLEFKIDKLSIIELPPL